MRSRSSTASFFELPSCRLSRLRFEIRCSGSSMKSVSGRGAFSLLSSRCVAVRQWVIAVRLLRHSGRSSN